MKQIAAVLAAFLGVAGVAIAQPTKPLGLVLEPVIAAEFSKCVAADAVVTKLAGDMKFIEGPVWMGSFLLFSDTRTGEVKKWDGKELSVFRKGPNTNGNTRDPDGKLVSCEFGSQRVVRIEADGTTTELAGMFGGAKFNSPNDVVVRADGAIFFTDPPYGVPRGQTPPQPKCYVFCLMPGAKEVKPIVEDFDRPNGLCLSPDQKRLYVADSGKPHHIRVFDLAADGSVNGGRVFCVIDKGSPDGIRCDADGRVWSSAGDGVQIFGVDGKLVGKIHTPEVPANLEFGGIDGKTLFITARTGLYSVPVMVNGAGR